MLDVVNRSVVCIIFFGVILCFWCIEGDVYFMLIKSIMENGIISVVLDYFMFECICGDNSFEWVRVFGVSFGSLEVCCFEEDCMIIRVSFFEIDKSVIEL